MQAAASCCIAGAQDCVTIVSGGDDQAVRVAVFQCCTNAPVATALNGLSLSHMQLKLLSDCRVDSAHSSAIRVSTAKVIRQCTNTQHAE